MLKHYFVRLGLFGQIGRLSSTVSTVFQRGRRVVCRTTRGLEIGEILGEGGTPEAQSALPSTDGSVVRYLTAEDELVLARLQQNRDEAFHQCEQLLGERGLSATLVDVEHLFDGKSLYFYFLGEVTAEVDQLTRDLAEAYETKVQFRQFADALERGCGPGCGTDEAAGCGSSGGCASCSIATACQK